jgi:2-haloacid dehalogenase
MPTPPPVHALIFDVFGTVVDWRGSIIAEGAAWDRAHGTAIDWPAFADAWRGRYAPSMDRVRRGELPWTNLDGLHRQSLAALLPDFGFPPLTDAEQDDLNRIWHRLNPWPDSVPGLTRLRQKFTLAPMSNGNVALLTNMAKRAGLPWDCILGAELVRAYKPDPATYQAAAVFLGLPLDRIMMVAAHQSDLRAAAAAGLRTAFIPRPLEFGPDNVPDLTPDPAFDLVAPDFLALADQLNCP